jgi:hypothetical protein
VLHAGDAYRIRAVFDPRRAGILLLGGRKADKKWYKSAVAAADKIDKRHLEELEAEGLIEEGRMRATWRDIQNRTMTEGQQARAHPMAMRDLREMDLREPRETLRVTQVALARKLKTIQAAVSRLEKRPGMVVSSLGDYVDALGGKIEVRAALPDRADSLTQLFRNNPVAARLG